MICITVILAYMSIPYVVKFQQEHYGEKRVRVDFITRISHLKITWKRGSLVYLLMMLPSALILGLRYGISTDYVSTYEKGYARVLSGITSDHFEWGFYCLIKICGLLSEEAWPMFLVTGIVTVCFFMESFKRSSIFLMSIVLFFAQGIYFDTFNGIRQYIVVAIFLYCIQYIESGDIKKYFIIMGLCLFIHTSAIITLPLYFINKIKINYITYAIVLLGIVIFHKQLYGVFVDILSLNSKYYANFIVKGTLDSYVSVSTSQFVTSLIALSPMLFVYKEMKKTPMGMFYFNMTLLNLAFATCSIFLPLMERVMYYSKSSFLLGIPYACELIKTKNTKTLFMAGIIFLLAIMNIYGILVNNWYAVLPYQSIFTK